MTKSQHIFICAGEASGDTLGAILAEALLAKKPSLKLSGMGSDKMATAGVNLIQRCDDIAVVGIVEVLTHFREIKHAFQTVKHYIQTQKPDLVIFIDYPGFNLRMAKIAKAAGCKVMYYVSPQIWAWKAGRIHKIKACVDHMATLFAFEEKIYRDAGVPATFVGHPLVDKVKASQPKNALITEFGLNANNPVVCLMPGSRQNEIKRLAPCLLETAQFILKQKPETQFILPLAPTIKAEDLPKALKELATLIPGRTYDALAVSDAAITASGTATLEVALMQVPMAIIYKVSTVTYWIAKHVIKIPHIGLCNIICRKEVAPEFLQHDMQPNTIGTYILKLLNDPNFHQAQKMGLRAVRDELGATKPPKSAADVALDFCLS